MDPESPLKQLRRRLASWRRGVAEPGALAHSARRGLAGPDDEIARRADRVEALRRDAHLDEATGLPNRDHFVARLAAALQGGGAPDLSLLLLRATNLDEVRERLGAEAVERRLALLGEALDAYPQHVPGAFAGRLNDADFGLCLPATGVADETASTLLAALRATPAAGPGSICLVVGGLDSLPGASPGAALAAADFALAHAEQAGPFGIEIHRGAAGPGPVAGEQAWRGAIARALDEGRARIAEHAVVDRQRRVQHRMCRLQLQLEVAGPFVDLQRWLAMAARTRLLHQAEQLAVALALVACERDGIPRRVRLSSSSLLSPGFGDALSRQLEASADAAHRLLVDIGDGPALDRALPLVVAALPSWRAHGLRIGVEHGGGTMHALARLAACGLDRVTIGAELVAGLAAGSELRAYAGGLADLVHALGVELLVDDVGDADDLETLFAVGVDAASGAAVDDALRA